MLKTLLPGVLSAAMFVCVSSAGLTERFAFDGDASSAVSSRQFAAYNGATYGPDENGVSDGAVVFGGANHLRSNTFDDRTVFGTGFPLTNSVRVVFKVDDFSAINTVYSTYDSNSYDGFNLLQLVTETGTGILQLGSRTTVGGHRGWGIEGPALQAGRYYHVVVRWDQAAQTAAMYVDGVKYDTITGHGIIPNSPYTDGGALYVGASRFQGNIVHLMKGAVSDLAFYDHAWTDAEVADDYASYLGGSACCDALSDRMDGLEANFSALQGTVSGLSVGLGAATDALEDLSGEVSGLASEITQLTSVQDGLLADQAANTAAIAALQAQVAAIETTLSALQTSNDQQDTSLDDLQAAIDQVAQDLAEHEALKKHKKSKKSDKSSKSKKSKKSKK